MDTNKIESPAESKASVWSAEESDSNSFEKFAVCMSYLLVILTFPLSILFCIQIVLEYERAVIFRLGKLRPGRAREAGVLFFLPCVDEYFIVDLRTEVFDVFPQDVLTKDAASIKIDAVVFFRVKDPILALIKIGHYKYSTMLLAQATLRNIVGTKMLAEVLTEKEIIAHTLQILLDEGTNAWGIKVERVEIKHISLPAAMLRSMAAEAEANRQAIAKKIAAEGEKSASEALKQASLIMSESSITIQLRYMQSLQMISTESSGTIILPLPSIIAKRFLRMERSSFSGSGLDV